MISVSQTINPKSRFSDRAENYMKYRPGYPPEIINFLTQQLGIQKESKIADIGSGTGLFGEPLLKQGYTVICIEPNAAMRKAAEAKLSSYPGFISSDQSAEKTGLNDNSTDLITVAQTFHWLDAAATQREFRRILKPGGHTVLAWNIQKTDTPFMKKYMALKEQYKNDEELPAKISVEKITNFFGQDSFEKISFPNVQVLDFDGLKGQLLSSSYIPLPGHTSYETMISSLVQLFVGFNENGFVKMEFETVLYWSQAS